MRGYSLSLILVVIGPNFLLRKMTFVTSFTKTWFSMWFLVMIAPMFLMGVVTVLDVIYPTKLFTFTQMQSYILAGGIFIITVAINIYFDGWFKNLYLIIPLSIMLLCLKHLHQKTSFQCYFRLYAHTEVCLF